MAATEFKNLPEVRAKLKPTLILVRHGSTRYDGEGEKNKIQGWMPGGLNLVGLKEAQSIGRRLKDFPLRRIYTSDLDRSLETAEVIGSYCMPFMNPKPSRFLRCWNMGVLQTETKTKAVRDTIDYLQITAPDVKIPQGESFHEFTKRFLPALQNLLTKASESPEEGFLVAVIHSDTLRVVHAWVKAGSHGNTLDKATLSEALIAHKHVDPGEAAVLTPYRDGYKISYLKGTP